MFPQIKILNLDTRVKFFLDIPDSLKWYLLTQVMIIVHSKVFEPFGIAVVEGMFLGAVSVVYKGFLSGPWIDIVDRGKYGFGFRDEVELSNIIENLLNDYNLWSNFSKKAVLRSDYFSYINFKRNLIELLAKRGVIGNV
ncbi:glycosyltransferase [Pyrobaculum arsenaticum]|uniref:Glycosyltransferase n=1 Tax=Pyrobaculum arsenaticum TaxID=121277 RepID=A0A7L4PCC3_9CREN|nr:glycosyltransferase [Pyrobaculum arsenaticum]